MFELHHLSAREQLDWLRRGEVTPTELVNHYLSRIAAHDSLGAFTTVIYAGALERAAIVESSVSKAAALWGLPIADKDLEERDGVRTTFGSRAFASHVSDHSDEGVIARDEA